MHWIEPMLLSGNLLVSYPLVMHVMDCSSSQEASTCLVYLQGFSTAYFTKATHNKPNCIHSDSEHAVDEQWMDILCISCLGKFCSNSTSPKLQRKKEKDA